MKLREEEIVVERSGDMVESMFGISGKDSAHILNILRDKLYSNKILAVVREYCTNAQDAHIEVGKDNIPIEVTIPSTLDLTFKVRDYGPGLSEDDIRNIYVMYGASTKRQTNKAIGQLGLGCKSAFAYSDKFDITSWYNSEKKVYCAYIDETKCGKITLMHTEESDEPEGIEIKVPVKDKDRYDFETEVKKALQFFDPQPNINGNKFYFDEYKYKHEGELENNARYSIIKLEKLSYYGNTSKSFIIMGGVSYPVDLIQLNKKAREVLQLPIHLRVNIGDVDITANREAVEYTEDTINTLNGYFEKIHKDVQNLVLNDIQNADSLKEANVKYRKYIKSYEFLSDLAKNNATWNDKKVNGIAIPKDYYAYEIMNPEETHNGTRWNQIGYVKAFDTLTIFIDDIKKNWKATTSRYLNYHGISASNAVVLRWNVDKTDIREIGKGLYVNTRQHAFDSCCLDDYNIKYLSQCKIPKEYYARKRNTSSSYRSNTHSGNIFTLKDMPLMDKCCKSKDWDKVTEVPLGKKFYVTLDQFFIEIPEYPGRISTHELLEFIACGNLVSFTPLKIYGVKKKQVDKLDKTWIPFSTELKNRILSSKYIKYLADEKEYSSIPSQVRTLSAHRKLFPRNTAARKLLNKTHRLKKNCCKVNNTYKYKFKRCLAFLGISDDIKLIQPTYKIDDIIKIASEKYKMTDALDLFPGRQRYLENPWYDSFTKTQQVIPHLVDYIKMIEKL